MDADLARRLDDATFPAFDLWSYHREVDDAINSLVDEYRATCGRTFQRFHYNTYFNAAKFLALNLFQARLCDPEGFLILSKDESYYSGEFFNPARVGYTGVRSLAEWMETTCPPFIEVHDGHYFDDSSYRTRIRELGLITSRLQSFGVVPDMLQVHRQKAQIRLRSPKHEGRHLLPFKWTRRVDRMSRFLVKLNDYISAADIQANGVPLTPHAKFQYRVFNDASWTRGGRFYGAKWQPLSKKDRLRITINGQECTELDFVSTHIAMAYALKKVPMMKEAYAFVDKDTATDPWRQTLKTCTNIALNSKSDEQAINTIQDRIVRAQRSKRARIEMPLYEEFRYQPKRHAQTLYREVQIKHRPVGDFFGSSAGLKFQNIDAAIAERVFKTLMKKDIVCLGIHDSFVVAKTHRNDLWEAMKQACTKELKGAKLGIKEVRADRANSRS